MLRTSAPLIGALGVTEMTSSVSFRFKSARFDYGSDLPEHYNAGNRFYGKDVAEFLKGKLFQAGHTASCDDEDWGWMVSCVTSDGLILEIAIYNLSEHMEGGRPGAPEWGLTLQSYKRRKALGFLPRTSIVDVPKSHINLVFRLFQSSEIELEEWPGGSNSKGT